MFLPQGIARPFGTRRCVAEIKATVQACDFVQFSRVALNIVSFSFHVLAVLLHRTCGANRESVQVVEDEWEQRSALTRRLPTVRRGAEIWAEGDRLTELKKLYESLETVSYAPRPKPVSSRMKTRTG